MQNTQATSAIIPGAIHGLAFELLLILPAHHSTEKALYVHTYSHMPKYMNILLSFSLYIKTMWCFRLNIVINEMFIKMASDLPVRSFPFV